MPKHVKVDEPERLTKYLETHSHTPESFKALVLKLVDELEDVQRVSEIAAVSSATIYQWLSAWNKKKESGLASCQGIGGGAPATLSEQQKQQLYRDLDTIQTHWTTSEVRWHIERTFGVLYSPRHVQRLLHNLGVYLGKPFALDQRRAEDSEEQLRARLLTATQELSRKGIQPHEVAVGCADEAAPQTRANRVRLWNTRHQTLRDTTTKLRSSTFGFYAIRGTSIVSELEDSKALSFIEMLTRIKAANRRYKAIIVIWDNLPSHKTDAVRAHAASLGIILVNVPRYSPDLNPIEYIWKSVRRVVAEERVLVNREHLRNIIDTAFTTFSRSMSFAKSWRRKLFTPIFAKNSISQPNFVF